MLSSSASLAKSGYAVSAHAPLWTILEVNQTQVQSRTKVQPLPADSARPSRDARQNPLGEAYRRAMVVPRMQEENIEWMSEQLPGLDVTIYVANNARAQLHPPKNKGHEVMVYFTFIIDHYEDLPDIVLFMHAHRYTQHNSEILNFDAVQMIQRLKSEYVITQGYVNMRCNWSPGCPQWLLPGAVHEDISKQEETVLFQSWHELFPYDPVPRTLAQACCAQFALSKERIRSIPKSRYIFYRDWILKTPLTDYVSGRIWEYSWQYLFTGQQVYCPEEHLCFCNGFGICFGSRDKYHEYEELHHAKQVLEMELKEMKEGQFTSQYEESPGPLGENLKNFTEEKYVSIKYTLNAIVKELSVREEEIIK